MTPKRVLILGGTREARELAARLADDERVDVMSSLSGATEAPNLPQGTVRRGGFGGADGLKAYLDKTGVDILVDATHPFASTISMNARQATADLGVAYLRLQRPAWQPAPGDNWICVANPAAAAEKVAPGAHVLLTIGRRDLEPFLARGDIALTVRMIGEPGVPLPADVTLIQARPPFSLDDETALMQRRSIDTLVTKNAGGPDTEAKLLAARERHIPVIMIERPADAPGGDAEDVDQMIALLEHHFA